MSTNILIEFLLTLPIPVIGFVLSYMNAASTRNLGTFGSYLLGRNRDMNDRQARLGAAIHVGTTNLTTPDVVQLRDLRPEATFDIAAVPGRNIITTQPRGQTMGIIDTNTTALR